MGLKKRILIGAGVLLALPCALVLAFVLRFIPHVPKPRFPAPANAAEADRQDLRYLRETFPSIDGSFPPALRPRFLAEVDALEAKAGALGRGGLAMGIAHAVALSNNGHTSLASTRLRHLPLRFQWFAEGLFVLQTSPENVDLLGARVTRIGTRTPEEAFARLHDSIPGNEGHRRARSIHFLDSPEALAGAGLVPSPEAVSLEVVSTAGQPLSRVLAAPAGPVVPEAELDPRFPHMPGCDTTCRWPQYPAGPQSPLYAQRAGEGYFRSWLGDLDSVYIRLFEISDEPPRPIAAFLAEALAEIRQRRPRHAIVDLRGNDGGNYLKARAFAKALGGAIPGHVFVITDGGTFSAALVTAAYLKFYSGGRARLVGEHPGDFEQFWAEGGNALMLPNSGLRIWMATGYHDWEHGCTSWSRCFWPNVLLGVAAGKLDPDLPVASSFAAWEQGRDEALESIAAFLHAAAATHP